MINNISLDLKNERHSSMVVANEAGSKIRQLQVEKASLMVEISQVQTEADLHISYYYEVHDALKQIVLDKDNQIEELNLQLTQIKNMESSSNFDVVEGVLNDDVVLDDLYDIGVFTNSVKEIGPPFSKEVQFLDNILEDLYSLSG
ncbi:hypothetical protein L7F22_020808 [Adiantum nelumboides]|nr:hypothetical protein [Adiantum nelumboides]